MTSSRVVGNRLEVRCPKIECESIYLRSARLIEFGASYSIRTAFSVPEWLLIGCKQSIDASMLKPCRSRKGKNSDLLIFNLQSHKHNASCFGKMWKKTKDCLSRM